MVLHSSRKYDPSDNKQHFNNIALKIHCCRYWKLSEWECKDMAFPFWRVYHNVIPGAHIIFNDAITGLDKDHIIIIPPNTSYSNVLRNHPARKVIPEGIGGDRIQPGDSLEDIQDRQMVDHLFIHFNLGIPFDFAEPGIYILPVDVQEQNMLQQIKNACVRGQITDLSNILRMDNLITGLAGRLPEKIWININIDPRVARIANFIEKNIQGNLSNQDLAGKANMATNAFARLFRQTMGESLQHYVIRRRVEKAQHMLHHQNIDIGEIALACGFCDRNHFSKTFKHFVTLSPASYRDLQLLKD